MMHKNISSAVDVMPHVLAKSTWPPVVHVYDLAWQITRFDYTFIESSPDFKILIQCIVV